ncbi:WXG100 family type VII secretion target [Haloglycomyces albus]|uniref:WXG100 family type VII secretion target n=1 Tax=Haloglycomyces albus TaxID=526067 RepID=UPI00046D93A6|nr:type VII secretion target [Haloglycomyces albus]
MTSFNVDPEQLRQSSSGLKGTEGEIDELAEYAKEADPDWWIWGLPGLVMAPPYFMVADFFHSSISDAKEAIDGVAEGVEKAADKYEEVDDAIAKKINSITEHIDVK